MPAFETFLPDALTFGRGDRVERRVLTRKDGSTEDRYDVRWYVNGQDKQRSFADLSKAVTFANRLQDEYNNRVRFCRTRLLPVTMVDTPDTVFEVLQAYWPERWVALTSPGSREGDAWTLAHMVSRLLKPSRRAITDTDRTAARLYLLHAMQRRNFLPQDESERASAQLLAKQSALLVEVTKDDVKRMMAASFGRTRSGKPAAQSSISRYSSAMSSLWTWFADRHPHVAVTNPVLAHGYKPQGPGQVKAVDPSMVMTAEQVRMVADAYLQHCRYGARVRALVLLIGTCAPRPGEALAIQRQDLDLPNEGRGTVTLRRSHREGHRRYSDTGLSREEGPLKRRKVGEIRTVPIPAWLVAELRAHIKEFVRPEPTALVFTSRAGLPVSKQTLWRMHKKVLAAVFHDDLDPTHVALRTTTVHDLRHSAISHWFNRTHKYEILRKWAGHQSLKTFLEVYVNVRPGDEDAAMDDIEDADPRARPGLRLVDEHRDVA